MEETFEVRFESPEEHFLYHEGVNTGFTITSTKMSRNYFIQVNERQLLDTLKTYAQGKNQCFPGRETLKHDLGGWSNGRLISAINEAEKIGLISTTRTKGKNTLYYICELRKVPAIHHSEFIHSIRKEYTSQGKVDKFRKAFDKYIQSELKVRVCDSVEPLSFEKEIKNFFSSYIEGTEKPVETKEIPTAVEVKAKPKNKFLSAANIPIDADSYSDDPLNERKEKKPPKSKNPDEVDIVDWNTHHFLIHFKKGYKEKINSAYPSNIQEDLHALKHVITQTGDKEKVRKLIDLYFNSPSITHCSIRNFASAFVQQKLLFTLNSGSSTSYKKNSGEDNRSDEMKDWASKLDNWGN